MYKVTNNMDDQSYYIESVQELSSLMESLSEAIRTYYLYCAKEDRAALKEGVTIFISPM